MKQFCMKIDLISQGRKNVGGNAVTWTPDREMSEDFHGPRILQIRITHKHVPSFGPTKTLNANSRFFTYSISCVKLYSKSNSLTPDTNQDSEMSCSDCYTTIQFYLLFVFSERKRAVSYECCILIGSAEWANFFPILTTVDGILS